MNVNLFEGMTFLDGTFNEQGGTDRNYGEDKLKEDIVCLLTQEKGKFYPDPDFGSNLMKYMFEPMTESLAKQIQVEVSDVIEKYYPQINLVYVDISMDDKNNSVGITIGYTYSDSDEEAKRIELELFNRMS